LRGYLLQRNIKTVTVVTSNYHTRRARYIFQKVFPQGSGVRVASARDGDFDPDRWWEKRKSIKELAREWIAYLFAMWELRGRRETSGTTQPIVDCFAPKPQLVV